MSKNWGVLSNFLAKLRFGKAAKQVSSYAIICDVGCGVHGSFLHYVSGKIQKGYGFDKKVEPAQNEKIKLEIIDDLEQGLPLADESVTDIVMLALIEHLYSPDFLLKECYRVLKPGGRAIFTVPSPQAKPLLEFLAYKLHICSEVEVRDHKHYYSNAQLKGLFYNAGFADVKVGRFLFFLNQYGCAFKN
ncbi:class I SAM-dependent methyltransferase [Christensenellaceae bacterium OttesenSCG-928-K19]|nr:class I SAM-dependent methyltransferase [Christensenellaceae bacterium OttesenSCG-928-K19]